MPNNAHNSLISTPTNCTGNRREPFLFVFNSFASICRKLAAGRDGFVMFNKSVYKSKTYQK